jgi:superfamily II DNA or RNA helicase
MTASTRQLRSYQQNAITHIQTEWAGGIVRTAIVHPTGAGKNDTTAKLCVDEVDSGGRVLFLAHRVELLDQIITRISHYSPLPVGRIQGNRSDTDHSIVVASVQTLCRPKRRAALTWQPTLVIIDECQHSMTDSYLDIAQWAGCFDGRRTRLLGVTATLSRTDGQSFDGLFQSVADVISYDWAFRQKLLVQPVTKHIALNRFWDRFSFRSLSAEELLQRDAQRAAEGWVRKAKNRITIAYAQTIVEAHYLTAAFESLHVPVALVIGTTPYEDRKLIYKQLAAGEIRVMVNVNVATEGFDCPQVSCILLARFTQSAGLFTQMIGRGLRPCIDPATQQPWIDPTTGKAKTNCLILDTVGATWKFDLTTLIDINPRNVREEKRPHLLQKLWHSVQGR